MVSRWLWPGNRTFLEVASMVVAWWIVALCAVTDVQQFNDISGEHWLLRSLTWWKQASKITLLQFIDRQLLRYRYGIMLCKYSKYCNPTLRLRAQLLLPVNVPQHLPMRRLSIPVPRRVCTELWQPLPDDEQRAQARCTCNNETLLVRYCCVFLFTLLNNFLLLY